MKRIRVAVDILTTSALHITSLQKGTVEDGVVSRYKKEAGSEAGLTITMPIVSAAWSREGGSGSVVPEAPIIPANTLGGRLRRNAADLICASVVARGMHLTVDAYNTLTSGSALATLTAATKATTIRVAQNDPFFGLFGGTTLALSSGMVICDGLPLVQMTSDMLMTPPLTSQALPNLHQRDMLVPVQIVRKNDVKTLRDPTTLEALVGVEAVQTYLSAEGDRKLERNENKAAVAEAKKAGIKMERGKKNTLEIATAFDAAAPGLGFALRFEVRVRNDAQLGLFLLALQKLLRDGQLGGKSARGLGRFVVTGSRLLRQNDSLGWDAGLLFTHNADSHEPADDEVASLLRQGEDWIDNANPALLEAFATGNEKAIEAFSEAA